MGNVNATHPDVALVIVNGQVLTIRGLARRMSSWRRLPAVMKLSLTAVLVVAPLVFVGCSGGLAPERPTTALEPTTSGYPQGAITLIAPASPGVAGIRRHARFSRYGRRGESSASPSRW